MTTDQAYRWTAAGSTDDVTTCDHCGRVDLKTTVRMVATGPDGDDDGEQYMGVVCAVKMTGRKAADIRTEAARADRAREQAIRDVHNAWGDARSSFISARREAAIGRWPRWADIRGYNESADAVAALAAWDADNPAPPRP